MNKKTLKPPSGFVEYSPKSQADFDFLKEKIEDHYKALGFSKMDTPCVESLANLLAKGSCDQEIFTLTRFEQAKNPEIGLRFDLTVPFARYVAAHQTELVFPFKRYQIGRVWRGERAQSGRYREFYQCDVDIVAPEKLSSLYDAYIVFALYSTLKMIGVTDMTISLNDKRLLESIADFHEVPFDNQPAFFRLIDKKEKLSPEVFAEELIDLIGVGQAQLLLKVFTEVSDKSFYDSCHYLQSFYQHSDKIQSLINEMEHLYAQILAFGVSEKALCFDMTIARGLNYYSGLIFETTWNDYPQVGSIASGGRYNNLVESFSKRSYQGIGFSIGLSRLFSIILEQKIDVREKEKSGVMIGLEKNQLESYSDFSQLYSDLLHQDKHRVDLYLQQKKYQDQIQYAKKNDYRYFISKPLGETSMGSYEVKDLISDKSTFFENKNDLLGFFNEDRV